MGGPTLQFFGSDHMTDEVAARGCPMCRSLERSALLDVFKDGTLFALVRCTRCRFVYVSNPRGERFETDETAPADVPARARHRQIKRICDRRFTRDANAHLRRVVEIGAGWGGLARIFESDDRYRYVGLEPSAARARFCRGRGLNVRQGMFDGPCSLDGPADAIVIDNVLEHVTD